MIMDLFQQIFMLESENHLIKNQLADTHEKLSQVLTDYLAGKSDDEAQSYLDKLFTEKFKREKLNNGIKWN